MRSLFAFALLAIALGSGCTSVSGKVAGSVSYEAHAVAVWRVGGWSRVRWISLLPTPDGASACPVSIRSQGMVWLRACAGTDTDAWLARLEGAQQAMAEFIPDWEQSIWEIDLVNEGVIQHVRWSRGGRVPLRLGFSSKQDTSQAQRRVVRTVAHETFHVLEARRRPVGRDGSEYRASLAGICIELATFGSVAAEQWDNPSAFVQAAGLPPAQEDSLRGKLQAAETVARYFDAEGGRVDGLGALCRSVLNDGAAAT